MNNPRNIAGIIILLIGVLTVYVGSTILLGINLILVGVALIPFTYVIIAKLTKREIIMPFQVGIIVLFIGLIFGNIYLLAEGDRAEKEAAIVRADNLFKDAMAEVERDSVSIALSIAREASEIYDDLEIDNPATFLIIDINTFRSEVFLWDILAKMPDSIYESLAKGELSKQYITDSTINQKFIEKLERRKDERKSILAKVAKREALDKVEAEKAAKEAEKATKELLKQNRIAYEKNQRNTFLDLGLDIKVKVSGTNKDRLKLTYVLFNDVWLRKFETEGYYDIWRNMGFKRVDFKDDYDYHMYISWK